MQQLPYIPLSLRTFIPTHHHRLYRRLLRMADHPLQPATAVLEVLTDMGTVLEPTERIIRPKTLTFNQQLVPS